MALKICPDCGKKVSSRANQCPDCGCPSEFFEDVESKEENGTNDQPEKKSSETTLTEENPDLQKTSSIFPTDDSPSTEFEFAGMLFKYNDNVVTEEYRIQYSKYHMLAKMASDKAGECYNRSSDYSTFIKAAQIIVDAVLETVTEDLYHEGAITDPERIKKTAYTLEDINFNFESTFNKASNYGRNDLKKPDCCHLVFQTVLKAFQFFIEVANQVGNNYPIEFDDQSYIREAENALKYENDEDRKRNVIGTCVYYCPANNAMWEELTPYIFRHPLHDDSIEFIQYWHLEQLYEHYVERRSESKIYEQYLFDKENIQNFDFSNFSFEGYTNLLLMEDRYEKASGTHVPYTIYYSHLMEKIKNYKERGGAYFDNELSSLHEGIFNWIPQDYSAEQFFEKVFQLFRDNHWKNNPNIEYFRSGGIANEWTEKTIRKQFRLDENDPLVIYYTTAFTRSSPASGLVLTEHYLILLGKKAKCDISSITNISLTKSFTDVSYLIVETAGKSYKEQLEVLSESQQTFLLYLLKVYCVRFGNNQKLYNSYMQSSTSISPDRAPVSTTTDSINEEINETESETPESFTTNDEVSLYINENINSFTKTEAIKYYREKTGANLEDATAAVESIISKSAISNTDKITQATAPSSTVNSPVSADTDANKFCVFCGKKIPRTAKFCNYCGKRLP